MNANLTKSLKLVRYTPGLRGQLESFYNAFEPKGAALGLPPRTPEAVHDWIGGIEKCASFLMLEDGHIIGHSMLCQDTYSGEVAVFVAAGHRGQGIGKRLLQAVIAEAVELDLRRIWGIAEPDNVAMLRLAHACGFLPGKEMGEFTLDVGRVHDLHFSATFAKHL